MEQELEQDLGRLAEHARDDSFAEELYRGLANRRWSRSGAVGHVTLSWNRAEKAVNRLRTAQGQDELTLAQTGGEGEVSTRVAQAMQDLGWSSKDLDTGRHDEQHAPRREDSTRPADGGQESWERQAHAEADANRR